MHVKLAFFNIHLQVDVDKFFEHFAYVLNMFFANLVINRNIVKESLSKIVKIFKKKNIIYIMLIADKLIRKIKKRNMIFINFYKNNRNN